MKVLAGGSCSEFFLAFALALTKRAYFLHVAQKSRIGILQDLFVDPEYRKKALEQLGETGVAICQRPQFRLTNADVSCDCGNFVLADIS